LRGPIAQEVQRVVAIRDGKTAAETVRKRRIETEASQDEADTGDEQFEELIVLDSAGRLQIPKEYREQLAIQDRVRMEIQDGSIVILPVNDLAQSSSQAQIPSEIKAEGAETTGWLSKFGDLLRRKKNT
jgi:bifunctional DNA-binding transcriptional regulator/antitoxin component of YhaV-PrlF toxin-antitoxin module